jgi:hypothetical protein
LEQLLTLGIEETEEEKAIERTKENKDDLVRDRKIRKKHYNTICIKTD